MATGLAPVDVLALLLRAEQASLRIDEAVQLLARRRPIHPSRARNTHWSLAENAAELAALVTFWAELSGQVDSDELDRLDAAERARLAELERQRAADALAGPGGARPYPPLF